MKSSVLLTCIFFLLVIFPSIAQDNNPANLSEVVKKHQREPINFAKVLRKKTKGNRQLTQFGKNQQVQNSRVNGTDAVVQSKDDPEARAAFELLKTKNPQTGKMPDNIRIKELEFMRAQKEALKGRFSAGDNLTPWVSRGPHNVGGRTRALAVDVNDENIILAGGVSGGMWRSTDQGVTWVKTTGSNDLQSVTCIAQDTRAGQTSTWYYGTGEVSGNSTSGSGASYRGDGIYKSTDNGISWSLLASTSTDIPQTFDSFFDYNHEIVVDPTNGNVLVANFGSVYLSDDGGVSFSEVINFNNGNWSDVIITSSGMAYAAIDDLGVFSSPDGTNWTDITPVTGFPLQKDERLELALAASNENIFYLLGEDAAHVSEHRLWKFNESTDSWVNLSNSIPQTGGLTGNFDSQGGYDLLIKVKPTDENFVIIGGTSLYRSTDGFTTTGNTTRIGGYEATGASYGLYPNHHPDQHSFVFLSGNKAISGNDGGVQITNDITSNLVTNEAVDWVPLNNGYLTTQVYAVSAGPGNQIMAGFQDNSVWLTTSTDGGVSWTNQWSGDGAYSAFNADGSMRYLSSQNANIYRANYNGGANDVAADGFTEFTPTGYSSSLFITPFYLDPINDDLFYLGGNSQFYVNTQANTGNKDTGWKAITLPGVAGEVSEIGVSTNNSVFVGTSGGKLYKVANPGGAESVTDVTGAGFPTGYISGVSVNPFNDDEVLVTFSNYSIVSVFYTINGGTTWEDVSGNLEENADGSGRGPSIRSANILGNGNRYFVGTSTGLYSTTTLSGGTTVWAQENSSGIGDVVVEHVISRTSDGLIIAGTHGNGVFSASFEITGLSDIDLAVTNIISPETGVLSASETVSATLRNFGNLDQSGYAVKLNINGTDVVTDMPATTILSGGSLDYTFSVPFDFSTVGDYDITVMVTQTSDANTANDEFVKTVTSALQITSYPYTESFEAPDHGWISNLLWELGTPIQSNIAGASDGTQAWMTDLDANYPNNAFEMLESPVFDFSTLVLPLVSFDLNYDMEVTYDGAVLAYRTAPNAGYTTVPLSTGILNWYNSTADVMGGDPAWSGTTSGAYIQSQAALSFLAGESFVQFAFIFASDNFVVQEGIAMDVFEISESPNNPPTNITLSSSTILENQTIGTVVGGFTTTDLDGADTHTYSLLSGDVSSFIIEGSNLKSAVSFNFENKSSYSIEVRTQDNNGGTFDKTFTISILDENEAPTAINLSSTSIAENQPSGTVVGLLSTNDVDIDDAHTYLISGTDAASFQIGGSSNDELQSTATFSIAVKSSYSITITSTDAGGNSMVANFIITVFEENTAPTLDNPIADQSVNEDATFNFQFASATFSDVDAADVLTYTATLVNNAALPSWLSFTTSTRTFMGTPLNSDVGILSIKVIATDNAGAKVSDEFDLTISNTNDAPMVANPIANQTTDEDALFSFQFSADVFTDEDTGDSFTYSSTLVDDSALPSWLSFDVSTRTFAGTPTNNEVGTLSVKVIATDTGGASDTNEFDIIIININDAPTFTTAISDQEIIQGETLEDVAFAVDDVDNTASELNVTATFDNVSLVSASGIIISSTGNDYLISVTPIIDQTGSTIITLTVTDGDLENQIEFNLLVPEVLGLESTEFSKAIKLYPNPVTSILTLKLPNASSSYKVKVFDSQGKIIDTFSIINQNLFDLDVSSYANGEHLLKIDSNNETGIVRFIKQ